MILVVRPDGEAKRMRLGKAGVCRVRFGELVMVLKGQPDRHEVKYLPTGESDDTRRSEGVGRVDAGPHREGMARQ